MTLRSKPSSTKAPSRGLWSLYPKAQFTLDLAKTLGRRGEVRINTLLLQGLDLTRLDDAHTLPKSNRDLLRCRPDGQPYG